MGVRSLMMIVVAGCLIALAAAQDDFDTGESDIREEVKTSMGKESIFNISKETGMSPGVPDETAPAVATSPVSGAGGWSLTLREGPSLKQMNLVLFQEVDTVFGYGDITVGNATRTATAAGSLEDGNLELYVVPSGGMSVYKMDVRASSSSIDGSYRMYSTVSSPVFGMVMGSRSVAVVPGAVPW